MSIAIYDGVCKNGPWDGDDHQQISHPETAGRFNLVVGRERGSYTFFFTSHGGEWRWGPWIGDEAAA